jgi:WD40 repeat protein
MTAGAPNHESLPLSAEMRLDAVCQRFEAAWQAVASGGTPPRIEDYLPAVEEAERWPLLRELLLLELHYRRREAPSVEEYGRRFPAYAERIAPLFRGQTSAESGQQAAKEGDRTSPRGSPPTVPGYEILGELGRGGMGVVYEARHVALGRPVALKMLRAGTDAGEEELARFRTEAEAAARLQNPNIVQIYEVGEHQGLPYVALEFCPGGSLEKKLDGTPLPPQPAAQLVETLARAMHAAHAKGIVHRDLKPANVLLVASERPEAVALGGDPGQPERYDPKITDFGLAKRLDVEVGQTQPGAILGTPSYMAPEQASGRSKEIGPAADVYALGATLYECLTGRPPFKAATPLDTMLQVIGEEPVPPRALQPKLPRDLETVCLKCLEKEPHKRYATAEELADDLRCFQEGKPILARPVGLLEKAVKWARRRPAAAALAAVSSLGSLLIATGLVIGILVIADAWERERGTRKKLEIAVEGEKHATAAANEQTEVAKKATVEANANMRKARAALANNLVARAEHERRSCRFDEALATLDACAWDMRSWDWHYLRHLCQREFRVIEGERDWEWAGIAFCPDGDHIAAARVRPRGVVAGPVAEVLVWEARAGKQVASLEFPKAWVASVAFSRDGKLLAAGGEGNTARVWDWQNSRVVVTCKAEAPGDITCVVFSPDGASLAGSSTDKTARVWDLSTGRELRCLKQHMEPVNAVAFSPDGKRLATAGGTDLQPGDVNVWDIDTGQEALNLKGHKVGIRSVAFSPDRKRLASASGTAAGVPAELKLWDAITGREERSFFDQEGGCVAFSPDGKRLATYRVFGAPPFSVTHDAVVEDLERPERSFALHGSCYGIAFSPDGNLLVSANTGTITLWKTQTEQEARMLLAGQYAAGHTKVRSIGISPDSRRLASGDTAGNVKLVDIPTGKEILTIAAHTLHLSSVAWSPDGQHLATAGSAGVVEERAVNVVEAKVERYELKVWDSRTGKELLSIPGLTDALGSVAFSPDSRQVAGGGNDKTVRVWSVQTGQEVLRLEGHTGPVSCVAFAPDGQRLASSSGPPDAGLDVGTVPDGVAGELKVWDTSTGHEILSLPCRHGGAFCVAFSPDGKRLAGALLGQRVTVWEAATGQEQLSLKISATSVTFSPDGQRILTSGDKFAPFSQVKVWDAITGEEVYATESGNGQVVCSPDGQHLACPDGIDGVLVWDAPRDLRRVLPKNETDDVLPKNEMGELSRPGAMFFSPDAERLTVVGTACQVVQEWDMRTGSLQQTRFLDLGELSQWYMSPDVRHLAMLRQKDQQRELELWDVARVLKISSYPVEADLLVPVCFSPDGRRMARGHVIADEKTGRWVGAVVRVCSTETGAEEALIEVQGSGISGLLFSPDGEYLAAKHTDGLDFGGPGEPAEFPAERTVAVKLWEIGQEKEVFSFTISRNANFSTMAFSSDRRLLAIYSGDRDVKVWDTHTGKERIALPSVRDPLTQLVFSPDGSYLAGTDGKGVRVWDIRTGTVIPLDLAPLPGQVLAVALGADVLRLATFDEKQGITVCEAELGPDAAKMTNGAAPSGR